MCNALYRAYDIVDKWIQEHKRSFPPVVIHISDGESQDGDPLQYAESLRSLATEDGNVLLFNCHLSETAGDPFLAESAIAPRRTEKSVDSVCPYCGVGCQLTYHVSGNRIIHVEGRSGPANQSRLCVTGRYGFDYASSPDRLTVPLIRLTVEANSKKRLDDIKREFMKLLKDEITKK